jgi:hypothetical protein
MLILIVNGYDMEKPGGVHDYRFLRNHVRSMVLSQECLEDSVILERNLNELGDITVDWEHDHLHHEAERQAKKFDKIDAVIVGGDMSILPWEPQASQCVSLVHMCKFTQKPFLGVGFGAFCATYAIATRGTRFYMLNGPGGGIVDELPTFPRYSTPAGTFPSSFLDYDSGDMYIYKRLSRTWNPICNVGSHFISIDTMRTAGPAVKLSSDHSVLAAADKFGVAEINDEIAYITSPFLQHEYCKDLPLSRTFPVKIYRDWRLNSIGGLPKEAGLQILGQSTHSPLFLIKDNMLMLACRFGSYSNVPFLESILKNYFVRFAKLNLSTVANKVEKSLHSFLFGDNGFDGGEYDTSNDRVDVSPALSRVCIPTKIVDGPIKVDPPLMSLFVRSPNNDEIDFLALTKHKKNISVGKKPRMSVQNPISAREKRLKVVMDSLGMVDNNQRIAKGLHETVISSPYSLDQLTLPEQAQDLLAGLVMNETSVTTRRHRVMQTLDYQATHITLEDKAALAAKSYHKVSVIEEGEPSDDGNSNGCNIDDEKSKVLVDTSNSANRSIMEPISLPTVLNSHFEVTTNDNNPNNTPSADIMSSHSTISTMRRPNDSVLTQAPSRKKCGVPVISDWVKVFDKPSVVTIQGDGSFVSSMTERYQPENIQMNPQKPATARSTRSIRSTPRPGSKQRLNTPRTAGDIMQARNLNFLPVSHPIVTTKDEDDNNSISVSTPTITKQLDADEASWQALTQHADPAQIGTICFKAPSRQRPQCTYKKIQQRIEKSQEVAYQGSHKIEYMSQREMEIKLEYENKKKCIAGPFKLQFGQNNTAMPKGKEGLIRPHGAFPKFPGPGLPEDMPALDWNYVINRTSETWIEGAWK